MGMQRASACHWRAAAVLAAVSVVAALFALGAAAASPQAAQARTMLKRGAISSFSIKNRVGTVKVLKQTGAKRYEVQVSRDKRFSKGVRAKSSKKNTLKFNGLKKETWWFARARVTDGKNKGKWGVPKRYREKIPAKQLPKLEKARYHYRLRFLHQPYEKEKARDGVSDVFHFDWPCYLETDNPDPKSIDIPRQDVSDVCRVSGGLAFNGDESGDYDDIDGWGSIPLRFPGDKGYWDFYPSTHIRAWKVPGGYACYVSFTAPGRYPIHLVETTDEGVATVDLGSIEVGDFWPWYFSGIDALIDKVCDKSLSKGDQMQQVADYVRAHSYYGPQYMYVQFFTNMTGTGQSPWSLVREEPFMLNSSGSGPLLENVGMRLGYPVQDLYDVNEKGEKWSSKTPENEEWVLKHSTAYSAADDRYFHCCPYIPTGKTFVDSCRDADGDIPQFDFLGYDGYVDMEK